MVGKKQFSRNIWFLSLLNSVGAWSTWILLGDLSTQNISDFSTFGELALYRQLAFMLGAVPIGLFIDRGNLFSKCLWVEIAQICLSLAAFCYFFSGGSIGDGFVPFWVTARFVFAGMSFVIGFKLLTYSQELVKTTIGHLLVTQGAVVLASVICFFIGFAFQKNALLIGLGFDLVTSIIFAAFLIQSKLKIRSFADSSDSESIKILKSLFEISTTIFRSQNRKQGLYYISVIFLISGFGSLSLFVASKFFLVNKLEVYSGLNLFYGISLWTSGLWLNSIYSKSKAGTFLGAIFCIGTVLIFAGNRWISLFGMSLYIVGLTFFLHLANIALIKDIPPQRQGTMRSSMLIYLSLIFGLSEYVFGNLISKTNLFESSFIVQKCILGLLVLYTWKRMSLGTTT